MRQVPALLMLMALVTPAMAAPFDGDWTGSAPAMRGCAGGAESTLTLTIAGSQVEGTLHNLRATVPVSGTIDASGAGSVRVVQAQGTVKFSGDHFTMDWAGVQGCARHAEGERASQTVKAASSAPLQRACGFILGQLLFDKWQAVRGTGLLGCPVNAEAEAGHSPRGTTGRSAQFAPGDAASTEGYIIAATSGDHAGTAYFVHGCVYGIYSAMGGTGGVFGFPQSDEYEIPGGVRADFEGGTISYDAASGLCSPHITATR